MAALGKRGRAIVVSDDDDDDDDAIAPESTPRQIATPVSKLDSTSREAVSPSKTFPSSPPTDAKFWVEIPPSPRRRPLSSIDQNSGRKVQLKLDSFFSRPKPRKEVPKKADPKEEQYPTPASTSRRIVISDDEDEATDVDASPDDDACTTDACAIPDEDDFIVDDEDEAPVSKRRKPLPSQKPKSRLTQKRLPTLGGAAPSRASRQAADQSGLPPISDIPRMFDDLVSRAPKLARLVDRLNGRPLRVATMCSGTESPLLALRMITRSLAKLTGKKLGVEHIFSCEIEPFKQAYIERNFAPPILFRDVLELEHDYAHTAYGAKVRVPGNVDVLIAGTSCVDYSQLNRNKKTIEAKGESGRTFQGMLKWVDKHRPALVVLENICNCPWDKVCNFFKEKGYSAQWCRFDTKAYYIPHTRTRGYAFAIDMRNERAIPDEWKSVVQGLARPSSSPLEAFLLPVDDPRIHQSRQNLARESERRAGRVDWGKCESRHQRVRLEEDLGMRRPFTQWKEDGSCLLPDFAWSDWAVGQVDRVLDLLDISLLKSAQKGIDQAFKTQVLNVSQNVDRGFASHRYAICPCLTPQGLPYVTNRGGPLLGLEALSLQGLPIDELLLTKESEDNLRDLAGNAMSSTVVGASIIAALTVGMGRIKPGHDEDKEAMDIDDENDIAGHITGENQLSTSDLDLVTTQNIPIKRLLEDATRSVRLCECEGRSGFDLTPDQAQKCRSCDFTTCLKCGQKPTHDYASLQDFQRLHPSTFEKTVKQALPMRLVITGITDELLEGLRTGAGSEIKDKTWGIWVEAVRKATVENELKFRLLKRQEVWSASYESTHARMELLLDHQVPEWRLFGKANPEEPANAPIRKLLVQPIARMRIPLDATSLLAGKWELSLPVTTTFEIEIEGIGELLPSWEAKLGLLSHFQEKKSWSHLRVQAPADVNLDQDISGVYKWLENCGTATGALHKREQAEEGKKPMYFFFDPTRCGEPEDDFFVFSTSTKRYVWGEERPLTATVTPRWRPSGKEGAQKVECYMPGEWTPIDTLELRSVGAGENTTVAIPEHIHADVSEASCSAANALLVCTVPLTTADEIWPQDTLWHEIDRTHERVTYQGLAWLTERVRQIDSLANWMTIDLPAEYVSCERCAPAQPAIKWRRRSDKKWHPIEDPVQAGSFEQRMKNRPAPFVTQLRLVDGIASVRIGLNVASLLHRALSRLPTEYRTFSPQLSWRLAADYDPAAVKFKPGDPAFTLRSNKLDVEHTQPPNFKKYPLRPEQLRSLSWMLEREQSDECFMEEEVSEAMLGPLGWRAEGRAVRPVLVRGGVLADEVGYGKTAITLGLIDCSQPSPYPTPAESGVIPSKATLIVVPSHLGNQWPSEIDKFLGKGKYKVVRILNLTQLNGYTIADIADADIVIVSSSLFRSGDYLTNLSTLAGTKELPASDGRYFNACLRNAIQGLHEQVDRLQDEGTAAVVEVIEAGLAKEHDNIIEQSKRFVGSKYAELKEKEEMQVDSDSPDDEPKKAKNRTWRDAWKLKTPAVRNNWRKMHAPLIEMFHFNRLVVDEYTYLEGKIHAVITSINADHRWVLSGTPPIHDFAAVKTIAVFLGIHLGVDDTEEGKTDFVKKRNREQTDVEKFHSFREVHTPNWHRRRHQVAQSFLDQFMRKNTADIDEIPWVEHKIAVVLPAAERAIYLELKHHLDALDMVLKKGKLKSESDRDKRLQESLGASDSAEEALLKRCSHFDLDFTAHKNSDNAPKQCDVIVEERTKQLKECKEELKGVLQGAHSLYKTLPKSEEGTPYHYERWLTITKTTGVGDADATQEIRALIEFCAKKPVPATTPSPKKAKSKKKRVGSDDEEDEVEDKPKSDADRIWDLREKTHRIRRLEKELVGRVRSLRYFEGVRDLQKSKGVLPMHACSVCSRAIEALADISILSSCGHMACHACLSTAAGDESCPIEGCRVAAVTSSVIKASTLGEEDIDSAKGRHFGIKLEEVMKLIQIKIDKDERVLLFVQFEDLMKKVSEALEFRGIKHLQIAGTATKKSNTLEAFQNNANARVLLLNVIDESASGANLTNANHAIFLSPLLAVSKQAYDARETQAIGRIRRYGQVKHVHIYRFLTMDSVDETIFKERTGLGPNEEIEGCTKVVNLDLY